MMIHAQNRYYSPVQSRALEDHYLARAIDLKLVFRPTNFRAPRAGKTEEADRRMTARLDGLVRLIDRPMTTPEIRIASGLTKTQTQKTMEVLRHAGRVGQIAARGGRPSTYFPIETGDRNAAET